MLKSCPFCGDQAKLKTVQCAEDEMSAWVECNGCGARTESFEDAYAPVSEAEHAWNRRREAA